MERIQYDYRSRWDRFAFPETGARFSTKAELAETFSVTSLGPGADAAGIPLCFTDDDRIQGEGKTRGRKIRRAVVNDFTENTLIYGETGSMKTRSVIRPLIFSLACRGESMVVTDPKGELATDPKVRGLLDEMGYQSVFLDFRSFAGDGFNLFEYAYRLYRRGDKDKALANIASIIHALIDRDKGSRAVDPFWRSTAEQLLIPIVHALTDVYAYEENGQDFVNILSLASAMSEEEINAMTKIFDSFTWEENTSTVMFRNAVCGSEKTTANVTVSAASYLQPFLVQPSLARMLSRTTFDADAMYDKPTAVFLIVPDETSAYHTISGYLIDNFYSRLVDRYTNKYQNRRHPACRVNFVCDEFCNLHINDMGPKISACRSREIRFYLVCQSMKQLETIYPDAAIIEGNCKNVLFLQSSDPALLDQISMLCGMTLVTENGMPDCLVTTGMLRNLQKTDTYKEAIFIRDKLVFFARLADCDTYELVRKYASDTPAAIPRRVPRTVSSIRPTQLVNLIGKGKLPKVFAPIKDKKVQGTDCSVDPDDAPKELQSELDRAFEALFGSIDTTKKRRKSS